MKMLLIVSLLALASCDSGVQEVSFGKAEDYIKYMTYVQDSSTKLCFGVTGSSETTIRGDGRDTVIITNVPCTKEVLAIVSLKK